MLRSKLGAWTAVFFGTWLLIGCGGRSDRTDHGSTADESGGTGTTGGGGGSSSGGAENGGTGGFVTTGGTGGVATSGDAGTPGAGAGARGTTAGTGGTSAGAGGTATGGTGGLPAKDCADLFDANGKAFEEAVKCDPAAAVDQCTLKVDYGFTCGCTYFVNPANADAVARFDATANEYDAGTCSRYSMGVTCGACLAPVRGHCNASGTCEGVAPGSSRSCKVSGVVYADGDGDIPSPGDVCNTCS